MQSICGQFLTHSLSERMFRMWRLTSLLALSTIPFSSFDYGMVELRWYALGSRFGLVIVLATDRSPQLTFHVNDPT